MNPEESLVHHQSSPDSKIRLFRSLFRGRDDVYPRRFESRKTGRSGYAPACANEWVRGICEKPRIKCAECQFRQFLPITDDVIRWHLSGFDPAGGRSLPAFTRCSEMRLVSFWPSISIRKDGRKMPVHFKKAAGRQVFQPHSNDPDPVAADMSGCFSKRRLRLSRHGGWAHSS